MSQLYLLGGIFVKTLIVGSGAMGCLFGAKLRLAGFDVTLYNRENNTIKQIEKAGIELVTTENETKVVPIPVIYNHEKLDSYDLIIILVKAFATETVLKRIKPIIKEETIVLSLQNGVGNLEAMEKVIPYADLGIGGTGSGASVLGPGKIAHRATGKTNIGFMKNRHPEKYKLISDMLTKAGLETSVTADVQSVIWSKLMINVAFNSLTAITRLRNGDILLPESGESLVRKLLSEALEVAKKEGIHILYDDPIEDIIKIGHEQIARNQSSMLTDVLNERKTEIEVINGTIVRYGKKHGIPTPYNDAMTKLIHLIENSYPKQIKSN